MAFPNWKRYGYFDLHQGFHQIIHSENALVGTPAKSIQASRSRNPEYGTWRLIRKVQFPYQTESGAPSVGQTEPPTLGLPWRELAVEWQEAKVCVAALAKVRRFR